MKLACFFIIITCIPAFATPYLCADNNAVYDTQALCNSICASCTELTSDGVACDTNYQDYVFDSQKNITYALTKSAGSWSSFTNTVIIRDQSQNNLLQGILKYSNITKAWIGLYDPDRSQNFGSTDDTRFKWRDGSLLNYRNWASGQPDNNVLPADLGVISVYGEPWGVMDSTGAWSDTGDHSGQTANYPALVEFTGQLSCVSGTVPTTPVTSSDMISSYCNKNSNCYLCTDTTNIYQCSAATSGYLCPAAQTACSVSYADPGCSSGTLNTSTGMCEQSLGYSCSLGGTYDNQSDCASSCLNKIQATATPIYTCNFINNGSSPTILTTNCTSATIILSLDNDNGSYSKVVNISIGGSATATWNVGDGGHNYTVKTYWAQNGKFYSDSNYTFFTGTYTYQTLSGYTYTCPVDYTLSGTSCIKTGTCSQSTCPTGTTLSGSVCVSQPTCLSGTFDSAQNKCLISASCPYGSQSCVETASGWMCSQYDCFAASDQAQYSSDDSTAGSTDKKADGQYDDSGNCLGTIYIFNGNDRRCRQSGAQTGFTDCCQKKKDWFGLTKCSPNEQVLASLRDWGKLDGQCHHVGDYCAEKWLGVCVQKKQTYCCFGSPLARIIIEQGRPQLNISWGDAKAPNCRGFTPEEFQKLDFSKIDFSEWIDTYVTPELNQSITQNIKDTFENITLPTGIN